MRRQPDGRRNAWRSAVPWRLEAATLIGKRYVNAAESVELLCTSSGAGALTCDGVPMSSKAAKPLPASD